MTIVDLGDFAIRVADIIAIKRGYNTLSIEYAGFLDNSKSIAVFIKYYPNGDGLDVVYDKIVEAMSD